MNTRKIDIGDSEYPPGLLDRLGATAPVNLYALGPIEILRRNFLGLICSIQCPGSIVIKTLDAVRAFRDAGVVIVGGFHSPMEKESLGILLRGRQPVVLCAARGLSGLRIGRIPRLAMKEGRLLVLSHFEQSIRRATVGQALQRNNLVAALSDALLVPHAAPGGKVWTAVHTALERKQEVFTFNEDVNRGLIDIGVRPFEELARNENINYSGSY